MFQSQSVRFLGVPVALVAVLMAGCAHREPPEAHATSTKDAPAMTRRADMVVIPPATVTARHSHVEPVRRFQTHTRVVAAAQSRSAYDQPRISRLKGPSTTPVAEAAPTTRIAAATRAVAPSTPSDSAKPVVAVPSAAQKVVAAPSLPAPSEPKVIAVTPPARAPLAPPILNGAAVPAAKPSDPAPAAAAGPKVEFIPAPNTSFPAPANGPAGVDKPAQVAAAPAMPQDPAPATGGRPSTSKTAGPANGDKVASLGSAALVRDALDRADAYMKSGQIINARALLQDAARGESPELLAALAATYDPIVLVDYPAAQKAADAMRAADLYEIAIGKGSVAAKERLQKLKVYMSRKGN